MEELLQKVKQNLILSHAADDELLKAYITAAVSYAESYQHLEKDYYQANPMPPTTEQAVIMLSSHFYESRDGSTGGFFADNVQAAGLEHGQPSAPAGSEVADMSFGKMNGFAELIATKNVKDSEGFSTTVDEVLASIRVYREGRHGGQRWANLAAFSEATDLFRFRCIPGVEIKTDQILISDGDRFEIISVEDVKGRGMYTEVLAKKVVAKGG